MSSEKCSVCDGSKAKPHFGAVVCRACAAFFRRYVNTKRTTIFCNCYAKRESQYPCRLCRMKKCRAVGMQECKVQGPRNVNNPLKKLRMMQSSPGCSVFDRPRIEHDLKLHAFDRLFHTTKCYDNLELTRKLAFQHSNQHNSSINMFELSMEVKTDTKLLWRLCEMAFPEFEQLGKHDKTVLFFNFYTKWSILEMIIFAVKKNDPLSFFTPSGSITTSITKFYKQGKESLSEKDVERIFQPYWNYHLEQIIQPIAKMEYGNMENMALFGILLWDTAYANVSEQLAEVCRAMRNIMLRELSSYLEQERGDTGSRFFETLDTLNLIERAEHKCQEEMQLCGMYGVEVDDEMRSMWEKI